MNNNKTFFLFFGAPGSGKGTQAQLLAKKIKLPVISTGDLLRQEVKDQTKLGLSIQELLASGKLVSDAIVNKAIVRRMESYDVIHGAIFDGYPRRKVQQDFVIKQLESNGAMADIWAVQIDVSDKEVGRRLGGRRVCACGQTYHVEFNPPKTNGICDACGKRLRVRPEDNPTALKVRLDLFHKQSKPLINYWQKANRFININGEQDIKQVQKDLIKALKENKLI